MWNLQSEFEGRGQNYVFGGTVSLKTLPFGKLEALKFYAPARDGMVWKWNLLLHDDESRKRVTKFNLVQIDFQKFC